MAPQVRNRYSSKQAGWQARVQASVHVGSGCGAIRILVYYVVCTVHCTPCSVRCRLCAAHSAVQLLVEQRSSLLFKQKPHNSYKPATSPVLRHVTIEFAFRCLSYLALAVTGAERVTSPTGGTTSWWPPF